LKDGMSQPEKQSLSHLSANEQETFLAEVQSLRNQILTVLKEEYSSGVLVKMAWSST
jgi:hypothetical protein